MMGDTKCIRNTSHILHCYLYITSKLATVVEDNLKAPFSVATTLRRRGRCYSFPWIAPLYPWYVPYNAECKARRYQVPFFKSLVWLDLGLNPGLPDHWQTLYPLGQWVFPIKLVTILALISAHCKFTFETFFKTGESVIVIQKTFCAHFMLH